MLKKGLIIVIIFLLFLSLISAWGITSFSTDLTQKTSSASSSEDYPQVRCSNYTIENRIFLPYPEIITSDQQTSPSNASLLEKTLALNLSVSTQEVTFYLPSSDTFLAIDGASQSAVLRVNYTIYYPNGTLAMKTPVTTVVTSPMHFFILSPPIGQWRIVVTLIDKGETTAWVQAVSYNYGTKWVTEKEKLQIHLIAGQNLYFKIPLLSTDWFYLYVNRFARADVLIDLRKQGAYDTSYRNYNNYVSQLFTSKSHTPGIYLLKIINKGTTYGDTDIFIEIIKPSGINSTLNIDSGYTIKCRLQIDLEFFYSTLTSSEEWLAFDGAVTSSGMSARYLIIDPNLDIIFDGTSSDPASFQGKLIRYPMLGSYAIAVFGNQYATATIKLTRASSISSVDFVKLDQNWTFTQSGQAFYLKILQSSRYFLFAAITFSTAKVKCDLFNPNLASIWSWGPATGLAFYQPNIPSVSFYILKVTGQTNSTIIIHVRFQGLEDYQIDTPDSSLYKSRFRGDLIVATLHVRWFCDYILQHTGAFCSSYDHVYVALFDNNYNQKWSRTFTYNRETYFRRWRKGYENPSSGYWLQVFIALGNNVSAEICTLQSGDETQYITPPFQSIERVAWDDLWQVRAYKIDIGSPKWFGIVSQLLSINAKYPIHPYASMWVYDPNLAELINDQIVNYNNQFRTTFWPNPTAGVWLVVIVGFQHSGRLDPLNLSITYITDVNFPASHKVHNINTGLNYTTIQAAIDAPETEDGHTIWVETGIYYEHIIVHKAISLIGESREATIIDGFGVGNTIIVMADHVNITGFTVRNCGTSYIYAGITLRNVKYCNIFGNKITNNNYGIYLDKSSCNNISVNTFASNNKGIALIKSLNNDIFANTIINKYCGIELSSSSDNKIFENNITNNFIGIEIYSSSNNIIYHNNFINNSQQVSSDNSLNVWDYGYPSGGNYWSDYAGVDEKSGPYQNETGSDGIGDTPYLIDANNADKYPLIAPIMVFEAGTWDGISYKFDIISNSTISEFHFKPEDGAFLRFNVTGSDGTVGFCRVTIPKELLWVDDGWTITVGDQLITNYLEFEDEKFTYLYFTYNHSTQTVTIQGTHVIPEYHATTPPLLLLLITLITIINEKLKKTKNTS
ncbi:MAG: NosD domain-containing protein [Candidatus Aenigmatarchaeota archaeon]